MAKVVIADTTSGCGLKSERPGWFEIHFSNVREIGPDSDLTVELPVEVARQLARQIKDRLAQKG